MTWIVWVANKTTEVEDKIISEGIKGLETWNDLNWISHLEIPRLWTPNKGIKGGGEEK